MYCGDIFDNDWGKRVYSAGPGGLKKPFNKFQISTGVGKCCMDKYHQEMAALDDIILEPSIKAYEKPGEYKNDKPRKESPKQRNYR